MPNVAITVDCEAAHENRHCYAVELVKVAEEFHIPITWLIYVSAKDPMSCISLYHQEYLHRIPNWHEIGLHLHFEDESGYIEDPKLRGEMIRMGKDVLKTCHVKPTSFRAGCFALIPPDLKPLEDIGILVDSSVAPDANYKMFIEWKGTPTDAYHPDYNEIRKEGGAKLLELPLGTHNGETAYLDNGYDAIRQILSAHANKETLVIGAHDYIDNAATLRSVITQLKSQNWNFSTLTAMAAERL